MTRRVLYLRDSKSLEVFRLFSSWLNFMNDKFCCHASPLRTWVNKTYHSPLLNENTVVTRFKKEVGFWLHLLILLFLWCASVPPNKTGCEPFNHWKPDCNAERLVKLTFLIPSLFKHACIKWTDYERWIVALFTKKEKKSFKEIIF